MERIRRRRQGAKAWQAIVARFERSGLRVRTFCQQENIGEWCFYRWRSRLKGSGHAERSVPPVPAPVTKRATQFLDLGSLGSPTRRMEMRLELGEGLVLHLVRA